MKINFLFMKKIITISLKVLILVVITSNLFSAEPDCSKIKKNTGAGWLKSMLCKQGSDKLDKDGNFKKGTFNLLDKIKKK